MFRFGFSRVLLLERERFRLLAPVGPGLRIEVTFGSVLPTVPLFELPCGEGTLAVFCTSDVVRSTELLLVETGGLILFSTALACLPLPCGVTVLAAAFGEVVLPVPLGGVGAQTNEQTNKLTSVGLKLWTFGRS